MTRPRRLYKDSKGRYFYIVNNQQKFVKVPKDMAEKDVVKISLKTLESLINKRRVKRKKKRPDYKFEKGIVKGAPELEPSKLVVEGKKIPQIEDVIKNTKQKKAEQLAENVESFFDALANKKIGLLSGTQLVPSPEKSKEGVKQSKEPEKGVENKELDKIKKKIQTILFKESPTNWADTWDVDETGAINIAPERQTYKTWLKLAIDKYNLPEDVSKQLFIELSKNKEFEDQHYIQFEKYSSKPADKNPPPKEADKSEPKPKEPAPTPTPPIEPKPPKKTTKPPKTTADLMPSLKNKPKTTEQKLAETPSFSGTTPSGTQAPAAPMTTTSTSPMPESLVEKIKKELEDEEKARGLMGLGDDGDDGLYTDEIANIIRKRVGRVIPVIPSDKVKYLKDYVKKGDKNFAAVINTNPSNSDGSGLDGFPVGHWTSIFINNEDDYPSVEFFDPLVSSPPKELQVEMKKIAKKMNPERMFLYKENRLQRQAKEASTCGWHAAQFIDDRMNGESWCDATGYTDFINRMGDADDSAVGEKEVKKYIKKYKVYI